jgi:hypothetical protein
MKDTSLNVRRRYAYPIMHGLLFKTLEFAFLDYKLFEELPWVGRRLRSSPVERMP